MGIDWADHSAKANGGTEKMGRWLESLFDAEYLNKFQIIPSRMKKLDPTKVRIYWAHDLAGDQMSDGLKDGGWKQFHKLVFVSHWQRNEFMRFYDIKHTQTEVIRNAIDPIIPNRDAKDEKIRLIYHTTPHRGLDILYSAFEYLAKNNPRLHLDVFSSFAIYGWPERDEGFKVLFDKIKEHPQITYHGTQSNDVVRDYLAKAHIFAYPSTWPETSCISLIEAMSAGCICVHPDFAALPETAANWTMQYAYKDDKQEHVNTFASALGTAVELVDNESMKKRLEWQSNYTNLFYDKEIRKIEWTRFFESLKDADPSKSFDDKEQPIVFRIS